MKIWRARVFQKNFFFLHFQKFIVTYRHAEIVSFFKGSFLGAYLTPLPKIWRARVNFFFFFAFLTTLYAYPHHANRQISIPLLSEALGAYVVWISDALENAQVTVFFNIFEKPYTPNPPLKWFLPYELFFSKLFYLSILIGLDGAVELRHLATSPP